MFKVKLDIVNIKVFVNEVTKLDSDVSLVSGRYKIDAKSIMGIFSLDLSKPVDVVFEKGAIEDECETLYIRLKELNIAI